MIKRFSVKNYRGFSDTIVWDLSASNYSNNDYAVRNGIVKNAILLGHNGSGKSNLSLAIFDIAYHLSDGHKISSYYQNYLYADAKEEVVAFEYTFLFHGKELVYHYTKSKDGRLLSEKMIHDGQLMLSWDKEHFTLADSFDYDKTREEQIFQRDNAISVAKILYTNMALEENHYLIALKRFVDGMLWFRSLEDRDFIGIEEGGTDIHRYIIEKNLLGEFQHFLKEVSGQEFELVATRDDNSIYCKIGQQRIELSRVQSTGTSHLTLLFYWMAHIKQKSFVFIDEFDAFYHFELAFKVCQKLFALDMQVFFTSHNTYLISNDLLRPDCYFLIDGKRVTALNKTTPKELRIGHNLEKMYRGNTFGR